MKKLLAIVLTALSLGISGLAAAADAPADAAPAAAVAAPAAADAAAAPAAEVAAPAPVPNKGDTAWMLMSTALVLLMSVPALALFYGGLVQETCRRR
jgi:Amt family ammonium transporter